jgi:hypothetical protein
VGKHLVLGLRVPGFTAKPETESEMKVHI